MEKDEYIIQEKGFRASDETTGTLEVSRVKVNQHSTNGAEYHKWTATFGENYTAEGKQFLTLTEKREGEYILRMNGKRIDLDLGDLGNLRDFLALMNTVEDLKSKEAGYNVGFFSPAKFIEKPKDVKIIGSVE